MNTLLQFRLRVVINRNDHNKMRNEKKNIALHQSLDKSTISLQRHMHMSVAERKLANWCSSVLQV